MLSHQHLVGLGRRVAAGALLALVLGSGRANAQSDQTVAALERFRDSVATALDAVALRQLQRRLDRVRDTSTVALLRRGIVALRFPNIHDAEHTASFCQQAARREPAWPYPEFCLGLAQEAYGRATAANSLNLTLTPGLGDFRRAAGSYIAALARDPTFVPAAWALGQLVIEWRGAARATAVLDALRAAIPLNRAIPADLLLLRGRLERLAGVPDSAMAAFQGYDAGGGRHALALLEEARTELAAGVPAGESLYYAGAQLDDSAADAGYLRDVEILAPDSMSRGLEMVRGQARADWLDRFWTGRDIMELRSNGDRLREHYRRLLYATQHFARTNIRRAQWFCEPHRAYDSGIPELDDRGIIYVRHGAPEARVTTPVISAEPVESWRYILPPTDTVILHFIDLHVTGDFELVPSVFDLVDGPGCGLFGVDSSLVLETRMKLDPGEYSRWLAGTDLARAKIQRQEKAKGTARIGLATSTDTDPLTFRRALVAHARLQTLGVRDGRPFVHLAFAVRIPDSLAAEVASRPAIRAAVFERGVRIERIELPADGLIARPTTGGWEWIGHVTLPAEVGWVQVRAAVLAGDSTGIVMDWDSVEVDSAPAGAALSPLIVAGRSRAVPWATPAGDTAFFSPFDDVRRDEPVELYAELRAPSGSEYAAALTIAPIQVSLRRRLFGGGPQPTVISWAGQTGNALTPIRRTVGVDALLPGTYLVRLEVRLDGRTLRRETTLTID